MNNATDATTTEHKIGSTTYFVTSLPSENAKDTIKSKVEKLILKDINQNNNNTEFITLK